MSTPDSPTLTFAGVGRWRDYWELTKPKVSSLIVFTAVVGMVLASPGWIPLQALLFGTLGIALASGIGRRLQPRVRPAHRREHEAHAGRRPLPTGQLQYPHARDFRRRPEHRIDARFSGLASIALTAVMTFASIIGYAIVYTVWLKHATPMNIVIGGAAGAAPPVLGWAAVTGHVDWQALLLFLIIFTWTPPHFWALAIARRDDYAKAGCRCCR